MRTIVCLLPSALRDTFRSRVALQLELTALRHQPTTMKRKQRITEAFPVGYVTTLHDPDRVYGAVIRTGVKVMGIEEGVTTPKSRLSPVTP